MGGPALPWYGSACCRRPRADRTLATSHIAEGLKTDQRHLGGTIMAESGVILIGGAPFSGKTTLAKHLAAQRGYALVAIDDLGTAVRALTTPQSHPALHPMAGWDYRAYYLVHSPATLIEHSRREHDALWPAIAAVIEAHLRWAGPVILEGWQLDPAHVASVTHPQLRACWLLFNDAVLEARLRADTAFYQGCTDGERLIRHYLARCRWVSDRVRQAAVHAANVVLEVAPGETMDALVRRCVQHLWPEEASS
jgi:2-phosphoglycerate kinase